MHLRAEQVDDSRDIGKLFGLWRVIGTGFSIKGKGGGSAYICRCTGCNAQYRRITKTRLHGRKTRGCLACVKPRGPRTYQWRGTKDIPGNIFYTAKKGAALRGIPFEIEVADLQDQWDRQGGRCALTGELLSVTMREDRNASLDRINSSGPYSRNNIQWVSKEINIMKNSLPETKFVELCAKVVAHRGVNV